MEEWVQTASCQAVHDNKGREKGREGEEGKQGTRPQMNSTKVQFRFTY